MKTPAFLVFSATLALSSACIGSSGDRAFEFEAAAAGPTDATEGGPMRFSTPRGYDVELTKATLRVGAIYMNELLPVGNAQADSCASPGRYTAQVVAGRTVDLLDRRLQPMPVRGVGTTTLSRAGEVWLTASGDVYDEDDNGTVLDLEGIARRDGAEFPFKSRVTIGQNRKRPPPSPAQPGANPLCRERIVAPIPIAITPEPGGALELRVDPRKLFLLTEFAELEQFSTDPPLYGFADAPEDAPSVQLFAALRSAPLYDFAWRQK